MRNGERSYENGRENAHLSPMKNRDQLSAHKITKELYSMAEHSKFLNPKIIKVHQVERLIQRMIEKYQNYYEKRSPSREKH
jgi:hypothetical protein